MAHYIIANVINVQKVTDRLVGFFYIKSIRIVLLKSLNTI